MHLPRDVCQHVRWILARNSNARDIVKKSEISRPLLLALKGACVFYRDRYLAGGGTQQLEVALVVSKLTFIAQGRHHASRFPVKEEWNATEALRLGAHGREAKLTAPLFHFRLD